MSDISLDESLYNLHVEVQAKIDRVKRARVELAASIEDVVVSRETIARKSAKALKFIDDYLNPVVEEPEPISPETVDTTLPPEEEIPVYTTVDDEDLAYDNISGGTVDIDEEVLVEDFGPFFPADDAETAEVEYDEEVEEIEEDEEE